MMFPVSVAFYGTKIIENDKKHNKKMQVSPYILAGWLLDGTAGPVRGKAVLITRGRRIVEIWDARAKGFDVRTAIGTDAGGLGVDHGEAVREEIELFLVAGLGLVKAVQSATSLGAGLLGLGDRAGCLTPGSPATFVAVRAKPERLLEALSFPERACFKGIPVSPLSSERKRET